ncbi:hypothetical protein CF336_g8594 [Tilletia laevis]|nr:hypothetical protein CF336_g8594 [Tilletia laevis]
MDQEEDSRDFNQPSSSKSTAGDKKRPFHPNPSTPARDRQTSAVDPIEKTDTDTDDSANDGGDRGCGSEEVRSLRDDCKRRLPKLKKGEKTEWRYAALNKVRSMTLLYYFDLLSRKEGNPKPGKKDRMIYTWRCRCCLKCLDHPVGQTGNLVAHIRGTQLRGTCPSREKPQTPGVDPYVEESGGELKPAPTGVPASKSRASIAATSYHGADTTERLYGSQDINAPLVRRLALINVVENTLPFEFVKSPSNVQLFKAVDARSVSTLQPAHTVRSDLDELHNALKQVVKARIENNDSLMSLQFDAWKNSFQHSFVTVIASYIDTDWDYQEHVLSFSVLKKNYTAATFAKHIAEILEEYGLAHKWAGTISCDSGTTMQRTVDLLEDHIKSKGLQDRNPEIEQNNNVRFPSSFPDATQRQSGQWTTQENKVLAMDHHILLAVRAGFQAFGITLKTKTQQKVLALRPAPILDAQDSAAGANDAIGAADHAPDTDDDLTDDEDEDEDEDIEDDAYGASGYPLSDDGGGPGAADDVLYVVSAKPQTAMSVLERFVHAVRRTKRSQKQFRNCMEQVYRNDPDKKAAPLPPKPKVTRWNSYLEMVEAALSIRDAIDEHCTKNMESGDKDVGSCFLSPEKWKVLESLQQIFTLVNDVIKDMEAKNGTLCKVLDNYASLMTEIDSIRSTLSAASDDEESSESDFKKFLNAMSTKLRSYSQLAVSNRATVLACMLHPQHRRTVIETEYSDCDVDAERDLRNAVREMLGNSGQKNDKGTESMPQRKSISTLSEIRARRGQQATGPIVQSNKEEDEIARYLNPANAPWRDSDESPLKWWRDNQSLFPQLAKLARIILCIPGSTYSSMRVFSQAAQLSTDRRSRFSAKSISQLVTTKHWLRDGFDPLTGLDNKMISTAETMTKKDPDVP